MPETLTRIQPEMIAPTKRKETDPLMDLFVNTTVVFQEQQRGVPLQEVRTEPKGVTEHIDYFDTHWGKEGLEKDWYTLGKRVGFSMQSQMAMLQDTDSESVSEWTTQSKRDIWGFCLEYLSKHLVYPAKYDLNLTDGSMRDPKYGNKDIEDTISEKERRGSVKQSLGDMKHYFLTGLTPDQGMIGAPDGSLAVLPSPHGPSGLTMDNGDPITYPDSFWFVMQKKNGKVTNYTIKTDFNHEECREVINKLTGRNLSQDAAIEEYVQATAFFNSETSTMRDPIDMIQILQSVRKTPYAFENIQWKEVYRDILEEEKLYSFGDETESLIQEFEEFSKEGNKTAFELQKGLAVTLLRISKLFIEEEREQERKNQPQESLRGNSLYTKSLTYGAVMTEVAKRPGCMGGGVTTVVQSVVPRVGVAESSTTLTGGEKTLNCKCPTCGDQVDAILGGGKITCPSCSASAPYDC